MQGFTDLSRKLKRLMLQEHIAVHEAKNPVVEIMNKGGREELTHVMRQYSIFPKELVSFTEAARTKALAAGWREIAEELKDNIAEEMGRSTDGVSHYSILAEGLELGLGVPVKGTRPSPATTRLLEDMRAILDGEAAHVLGATYAIEATSIPELTIVLRVLEALLGHQVPEALRYFFDMHLNEWEPEHEEGLRVTVGRCLTTAEYESFEAGFRATMQAMDRWWMDLTTEALAQARPELQ